MELLDVTFDEEAILLTPSDYDTALDNICTHADEEVIEIKYKNDSIPRLHKIEVGDWIDLCASEDVFIKKGENELIDLGIAMKLPKGYEAYILPRSSTFNKYGCIIVNSMGVIDESYYGDNDFWKANFYCLTPNSDSIVVYIDTDPRWLISLSQSKFGMWIIKHFFKKQYEERRYSIIKAGERICQFRIMPHMPTINFVEVSKLCDTNRGGFGSTGDK